MFQAAVAKAQAFTHPYVGIRLRASGEVFATVGAFILLGDSGWAVTAGHVVDEIVACVQQRKAFSEESVPEEDRPQLIAEHDEIWAVPGFPNSKPRMSVAHVDRSADVAIVKFGDFERAQRAATPVWRDAAEEPISVGMSVCRLGFPFHQVGASFDPQARRFVLAPDAFPVPLFALEGIVSRFHQRGGPDGSSGLFIQTSTPGLRGQSGGPLLDVEGRVVGVQSHTVHLDLGFDARYSDEDGPNVERQFLNVGSATHVSAVRALLDAHGVEYAMG